MTTHAHGDGSTAPRDIAAGIITISDRAAQGTYADLSGPALAKAVESRGWRVVVTRIVPDEKAEIQRAIRELLLQDCRVILTTGGTGVTARDVTPEAVRELARFELPGFGEAMRQGSVKLTPNAILSRNLAVVIEGALVICLPGKPQAAVECLEFVAGAVPHCIELLDG